MDINLLGYQLSVSQKASHAGAVAVLFALMSLPQLYERSNKYFEAPGNCPSYKSKLLHSLVFVALAWLCMKYVIKSEGNNALLLRYAVYAGLLFFFVSSDEFYMFTRTFNASLADAAGCPTVSGLVVHTVVYWLVLMGIMNL